MRYTELSFEKLRAMSIEAAYKIKEEQSIDLIIFIAKAGFPIAIFMNEIFQVSVIGIEAQRKGNKIKQIAAPLLVHCPRMIRDILMTMELKSGIHKRDRARNVKFQESIQKIAVDNVQKILLVDDSVDTGNSMKQVCQKIREIFGDVEIITYALNVWKKSKEVFHTDYYSYEDTVIRTPMSKDAKEYPEFCKMYEQRGRHG